MQSILLIFLAFFLILLGVRKIYKRFLMKQFIKSFGQSLKQESYNELNYEYLHYLKKEKHHQTFIEDLQLDQLFNFMDRTYTDIGREYMFAQMFVSHHHHDLMEFIIEKCEDEHILMKVIYELNELSKKYSDSLNLFDDMPSFSLFRLIPLLLSLFGLFGIIIAYFCFQIEVVQLILIWLAIHVSLSMHYIQSINETFHQASSYCYAVMSLKKLNSFHIFPDNESKDIQKKTSYALKYIFIQCFFDMISSIDVFLIGELFKTILCGPILQHYIICQHLTQLKKDYIKIYEYIGVVDMGLAMKSIRKQYQTCIPEISQQVEMKCLECYHPLIHNCVKNSFFTQQSCMITGSNASGKSTFLKTVGINIVTAKAYHTCFADSFIYYPFKIYTSIHIKDDLQAGDSYYVKEIKVLKEILEGIRHQVCLVLIDEILRGTNEKERIAITKVILKSFFESSSLILVTTHDLSLTHFFNDIQKYCFNDYIKDNQLFCDYKINKGVCLIGNAVSLLKIYGYDQDMIKQLEKMTL